MLGPALPLRALCALALLPLSAVAQRPDSITPTSQPIELRQVATDPAMRAAMRAADSAQVRMPSAVTEAGRWRILASFGQWGSDYATTTLISTSLHECERELGLTAEEIVAISRRTPWAAFDSAASDKPLAVFAIVPSRLPDTECGKRIVSQPHAITRGLILSSKLPYSHANDPARVTIVVGERVIQPAFVGIAPVIESGRPGTEVANQLRLYVPLADVAPTDAGRLPAVALRIATLDSSFVDTVWVPSHAIQQLWNEAVAWRVERLSAASVTSMPPMRLPEPRDNVLARAHAALLAGQPLEPARLSRWRLNQPDANDRRFARVVVGATLLAAGDRPTGHLVLADAAAEAPCIGIDVTVPQLLREGLDRVRPRGRCDTRNPLSVFARGLLFPGGGQMATGRRVWAIPLMTLPAAALGYSALELTGSKADYKSYQSATSTADAIRYYDLAVTRQDRAGSYAIMAATAWIAAAIEAAVVEHIYSRRVARVRAYGAP